MPHCYHGEGLMRKADVSYFIDADREPFRIILCDAGCFCGRLCGFPKSKKKMTLGTINSWGYWVIRKQHSFKSISRLAQRRSRSRKDRDQEGRVGEERKGHSGLKDRGRPNWNAEVSWLAMTQTKEVEQGHIKWRHDEHEREERGDQVRHIMVGQTRLHSSRREWLEGARERELEWKRQNNHAGEDLLNG